MLMDQKGKLFGKVSIVDAIVALAVIIVAVGIYIRFGGEAGKAVAEDVTFSYTMEVKELRQPSVDALQDSVGMEFFLNEKKDSDMGTLTNVEVSPAMGIVEKTDGTTQMAEIPEKYDAILTFQMTGRVNDVGYYSPQLQAINVGTTYVIKSKLSTVFGIVTSIWE
jgi:hypothetical protein